MAIGLSALWKLISELQWLQTFELVDTPIQRQTGTVLVDEDSAGALGWLLTLASQCPNPGASLLISVLRQIWCMAIFATLQR